MGGLIYGTTIPRGFAGSRANTSPIVEDTINLNPTNPPLAFGVPLKAVVVSGNTTYSRWTGGEAAGVFAGILLRQGVALPATASANVPFSPEIPNPSFLQTRITLGSVRVVVPTSTSASVLKGGGVYIRTVAASGKAVGDFESTADGANNVLIPNLFFAEDGLDATLIAEVVINPVA